MLTRLIVDRRLTTMVSNEQSSHLAKAVCHQIGDGDRIHEVVGPCTLRCDNCWYSEDFTDCESVRGNGCSWELVYKCWLFWVRRRAYQIIHVDPRHS